MRNYNLGVLIVLVVGVLLGARGIFRLIKMKYYKNVFIYASFIIAVPAICIYALNISQYLDEHLRLWISIPLIELGLFWLTFGFIINKKVEKINSGIEYKDEKMNQRRIFGGIILLLSIVLWFLGAFVRFNYEVIEIILMVAFFLGMLYGSIYLITGKPMDKVDD